MYELTGHRFGIAHSRKTLASFPTRINAAAVHLDRDKSLVHIHSPYNACSQGKHLAHFTSCLGHSATDSSASTQPFTPWLRAGRCLRGGCVADGGATWLGSWLDKGGWQRRHMVGRSWRVCRLPAQDAPTGESSNCPCCLF
jgi:hypothetical protein